MTTDIESWEVPRDAVIFERAGMVWLAAGGVAAAVEILLHNSLFNGAPLGLGFTIATILISVLFFAAGPLTHHQPSVATRVFAGLMTIFGLFVTFRASPALTTLNVLTVLALLVGAAFLYSSGRLWDMRIMDYPRAGLVTAANALAQTGEFFRVDVSRAGLIPAEGWQRVRPYLRGIAIAFVPLVLFLGLFASADAVFAAFADDLFGTDLDLWRFAWAAAIAAAIGWMLIGLLRYGVASHGLEDWERPDDLRLGATEAATVLGLLNALFVLFVIIQFAYLFGGADVVARTGGLTPAEYAREGFFQLVVVAAAVLGLVLFIDWWTRPAGSTSSPLLNALQGGLIVLTGVVLLSAVKRMSVYVDEFGLTQLRFYAVAIMVWVGFLLLWALLTVLPGYRALFGAGAFLSALLLIAGLNVVNPDATIARTNIDRFATNGAEIDFAYLTNNLSSDAGPVLRANAGILPLHSLGGSDVDHDWRSFNLSRSRE